MPRGDSLSCLVGIDNRIAQFTLRWACTGNGFRRLSGKDTKTLKEEETRKRERERERERKKDKDN